MTEHKAVPVVVWIEDVDRTAITERVDAVLHVPSRAGEWIDLDWSEPAAVLRAGFADCVVVELDGVRHAEAEIVEHPPLTPGQYFAPTA